MFCVSSLQYISPDPFGLRCTAAQGSVLGQEVATVALSARPQEQEDIPGIFQ